MLAAEESFPPFVLCDAQPVNADAVEAIFKRQTPEERDELLTKMQAADIKSMGDLLRCVPQTFPQYKFLDISTSLLHFVALINWKRAFVMRNWEALGLCVFAPPPVPESFPVPGWDVWGAQAFPSCPVAGWNGTDRDRDRDGGSRCIADEVAGRPLPKRLRGDGHEGREEDALMDGRGESGDGDGSMRGNGPGNDWMTQRRPPPNPSPPPPSPPPGGDGWMTGDRDGCLRGDGNGLGGANGHRGALMRGGGEGWMDRDVDGMGRVERDGWRTGDRDGMEGGDGVSVSQMKRGGEEEVPLHPAIRHPQMPRLSLSLPRLGDLQPLSLTRGVSAPSPSDNEEEEDDDDEMPDHPPLPPLESPDPGSLCIVPVSQATVPEGRRDARSFDSPDNPIFLCENCHECQRAVHEKGCLDKVNQRGAMQLRPLPSTSTDRKAKKSKGKVKAEPWYCNAYCETRMCFARQRAELKSQEDKILGEKEMRRLKKQTTLQNHTEALNNLSWMCNKERQGNDSCVSFDASKGSEIHIVAHASKWAERSTFKTFVAYSLPDLGRVCREVIGFMRGEGGRGDAEGSAEVQGQGAHGRQQRALEGGCESVSSSSSASASSSAAPFLPEGVRDEGVKRKKM
uniref:Uncharacterized protein n=1 Tax=Chromera velia CCMP2878 TaxID=1169474 RepID=A0A0G4FGM2_9ALVE|eukprot:Cvel_16825.t1-p1 / transcript=Cvel_16825.t1 / gene=Cvel_16825 / organism=Chromera_velia_CCMP2878 / gene_product=hypothetical protein / transcript_product=hypothetical protein / location=Cvel_scaffold1314:27156-29410(+) / protein_length=623 / sequence_SO=supercontig / SO=protein_coding / is_pseudo=false